MRTRRSVLRLTVCGMLALCGCATRPARFPTLAEYTSGASSIAEEAAGLFESDAPAPPSFGPRSAPLLDAAEQWRAAAADSRAESWIVDFPGKPGRTATLRLLVQLEGSRRGDPETRLWADELFDLELERSEGRWTLAGVRAAAPAVVRAARPHLREVASEIGLASARNESLDPAESTNLCIPATHHHPGVVLADFDGDGSVDIVLPGRNPQLFLNDGRGHFRDATRESGFDRLPPGDAAGGIAADLDGDGLPELFLTYAYAPCRLLHNDGGGRFHDATAESGLSGLSGTYTTAVFFDADRDGRLDLFVAAYGDARQTGPAYGGKNAPGPRFFHNLEKAGRPFFVDETAAAAFADRGWGFAAAACDLDGDGDDDLYVANDFGTNCLYENVSTPGRPRFREIAKKAGVLDEGYGMGVAWGDYDGDGRFDLHVADFSSPYRWMIRSPALPMPPVSALLEAIARPIVVSMLLRRCEGDGLYRNLGNGTFEKTSEAAGVADGGWAWGTEFVDLEGTGREDLLVVNGMWQAQPGGQNDEIGFWNAMSAGGIAFHDGYWGGIDFGRDGMASRTAKHLYRNLGNGKFEEAAYLEGFDTREDTRGLAYGDLDGDGAPDVVLATFRGPLLVYRNGWSSARRLTLRLESGQGHNREAIGAVVHLAAGGKTQVREVRAGSSYLSCSAKELYFGLGSLASADSIEVRWPDGRRETRRNVPAGKLVWREGQP